MNDYAFGNRLLELRTASGLTQQQAAEQLGLTNKAVSKWETGKCKPTTNVLRKLAALYHISVEELLSWKEEATMPEITKIVITGGPCAGKTTAMSWIQNAFTQAGYAVLFVPETATELIGGGVAPWTCGSNGDYQKCQVQLQLEKERIFHQAALTMPQEKILIVCDRGVMDNKAYMTDLEFSQVMQATSTNEVQLRDSYDAVFHLVTAAKGAINAYTLANNAARTETPEQAAALDDKLIAAWTGHPHLRIIDNATDFETKMKRLIKEIFSFLGEPEPLEIERKFLISYPDISWLESQPNCQRIEIIQTYLNAKEGEEVRVRQRGMNGSFVYYKTTKRGEGLKRVETEQRLTQGEYLAALMEADTSRHQIRKTRYCLTHGSQYFEIDLYPFWKDQAIVEIELSDENEAIHFPKELGVIREVTEDPRYKNAALALISTPIPESEYKQEPEPIPGLPNKTLCTELYVPPCDHNAVSFYGIYQRSLFYNLATGKCSIVESEQTPAPGCPDWKDCTYECTLTGALSALQEDLPKFTLEHEINACKRAIQEITEAIRLHGKRE